jgi:hypothetical protein
MRKMSSRYAKHLGTPNLFRTDMCSHLGNGCEEDEEREKLGVKREEGGGDRERGGKGVNCDEGEDDGV